MTEAKSARISGTNESQLVRLRTQLASVDVLFAGASPERIDRRPASGKWSARENLAHLGRYHEIFLERVRRILTETSPQFPRYRAEEDPGWQEWASRPFEDVRNQLAALRQKLIDRIASLQPSDYARVGIHSAFGEMSLSLWLEFFLIHEAHHLYVLLQRLRER
jgi:DinB superfamily